MTPVFRFAPSPNGRLHAGHAYSALLNAALAQRMGGRFLVRMEDIDTTRCTDALARHCLEDLRWLGLTWEEPVRVQSQHWQDYRDALARLQARRLVYPCFCSRSQIAQASGGYDPDGAPLYPGTCRHLHDDEAKARIAASEPHAWRLDMARALAVVAQPLHYTRFSPEDGTEEHIEVHPARWGDVVLVRKEVPTSYHLAVVVDDALQGVTHVVRGQDLEAATEVHVLLQYLLGLPTLRYHHHALLCEPEGDKLAKSKGSESLADLRARGVTVAALRENLVQIYR